MPPELHREFDFQTPLVAPSAYYRYVVWIDHRYNNAPWSVEFMNSDFAATLKAAGFLADSCTPERWGVYRYRGVKPTA